MTAPARPDPRPLLGVGLKVVSTLVFTAMVACVKLSAADVPTGEIVFFRSFFALLPILAVLAVRGELRGVLATRHLGSHIWRGAVGVTSMYFWFYGIGLLPLAEAMAIGYASPLVIVVLAALVLGERIGVWRIAAVVGGFIGILVILSPHSIDTGQSGATELVGALATLTSAFLAALAMIFVRRLTATETTASIVVYFSATATAGALLSVPFGWMVPPPGVLAVLVLAGILGGVGQILMTESYRHAEASVIATFEYTSMVWSLLFAMLLFDERPGPPVLIGMAIVVAAGLLVIARERRSRRPNAT